MAAITYEPIEIMELFHLEFLRQFVREAKTGTFALKGGVNLRFFFESPRYSEDMDFDCVGIPLIRLQDIVLKILSMKTFLDTMAVFGIDRVVPQDMRTAKQTESTQRFKVHLVMRDGLDLFTKIEYSHRGMMGSPVVKEIGRSVLRKFRMAPFLAPHYPAPIALAQKIRALAGRAAVQARDVFDIYLLRSHAADGIVPLPKKIVSDARSNLYSIDYERFRDTVVEYLAPEDREQLGTREAFDEIRLQVDAFLDSNQPGRD
ncbi:MAG: nucleotidyl transferase AbiEii/AbiGii toxin family protein [Chitinispirillaceae bacterium]|nr:nucleotidyl transferase AbiEii/AbiGii toxin family protein [Chitinispirillaceae bacterium]